MLASDSDGEINGDIDPYEQRKSSRPTNKHDTNRKSKDQPSKKRDEKRRKMYTKKKNYLQ